MTKLRFCSILVAAVMAVAMVFVSCSPSNVADDEGTVQIYFGRLQAKAVEDTAYDVTTNATWGSSAVKVGEVEAYYWTYKATKTDGNLTKGQTDGFVNCDTGTGLGGSRTFSKGTWTFVLRAYASDADRTAGTQPIYEGTSNYDSATDKNNGVVNVPISFTYIKGTGTASIVIDASISQDADFKGTTYSITGVTAVVDGTDVPLTQDTNDTSKWKTDYSVASGVKTIGLKVYVDNETEPRVNKTDLGTAIILHGLSTDISGSATISLSSEETLSFSSSVPSEQPSEDVLLTKASSTVKAGDTLELGTYPATYTNGSGESVSAGDYAGKPVTWKVLDVDTENKKALVISEKVLTSMAHQADSSIAYTWSGSAIRSWLNSSFITDYGLNHISIAKVTHNTAIYDETSSNWDNSGTESTTEKIFLLSESEVENKNYFADKNARIGYNLAGSTVTWILRDWYSDVHSALEMYIVRIDGAVINDGFATGVNGVRPAFWIDIE